jgi:hypothetical protein
MAAPPPVPPILDADRYISYAPTSSTSVFAVPFPVFGTGADIAVYYNGVVTAAWTFSSASGATLSTIALPITDGQITLTTAISSGTLEIFGDWRPRQGALNTSPSIGRREYQQDIGQIVASLREAWTAFLNTFPLSKGSRANKFLAFDASGNPVASSSVTAGSITVSGPMTPVIAASSYPAALSLMGFSTWFQGLIGTTSSSAFWTAISGSSFGASLASAANAAAALTLLGVSSFMQTMLAAATSAAAMTALGLTTFGQSLVTAANAAAALTTLGFSSLAQSLATQPTGGQMLNLLGYGAARRQTVVGGPFIPATGQPGFLPATSGSLSLTSIGSSPLIVSAANGAASGGANDLIGSGTALTWSSLAPSTTNYLYVTVNAAGGLTPGSTTLPPAYQFGGTPSNALGQFTFLIGPMTGYMGNGSAAPQANVVFVGEAVTSGTGVTSTVAYQYNGCFVGVPIAVPATSTQTNLTHNLGVPPIGYHKQAKLICVTTDKGYPVGAEIDWDLVGQSGGTIAAIDNHNVSLSMENSITFTVAPFAGGTPGALTNANWNVRLSAWRSF